MPLAEALYNSIISNATGTQMKHFPQNSRGAVPEKLNWFSFLVKEQLKNENQNNRDAVGFSIILLRKHRFKNDGDRKTGTFEENFLI